MGTRSLERVRVRCRVRCRVRGRVRGRGRPSAIIPSSSVQHNVREGTNVVVAKCARKGYRIRGFRNTAAGPMLPALSQSEMTEEN